MTMSHWVHLDSGWHTTECAARLERTEKARAEWKARWPNACPACEGAGGVIAICDPSPRDVISLPPGWMTEFEFCDTCQCGDEVRCPRCEAVIADWEQFQDQQTPCPHCGWDWGNGADDVCPPDDRECACWAHRDNPFYKENDNGREDARAVPGRGHQAGR